MARSVFPKQILSPFNSIILYVRSFSEISRDITASVYNATCTTQHLMLPRPSNGLKSLADEESWAGSEVQTFSIVHYSSPYKRDVSGTACATLQERNAGLYRDATQYRITRTVTAVTRSSHPGLHHFNGKEYLMTFPYRTRRRGTTLSRRMSSEIASQSYAQREFTTRCGQGALSVAPVAWITGRCNFTNRTLPNHEIRTSR